MAEQDDPGSTRGWKPGFIAGGFATGTNRIRLKPCNQLDRTPPCNFPTNIKHPLETLVEGGIYSTVFIWEPNNGHVHTTREVLIFGTGGHDVMSWESGGLEFGVKCSNEEIEEIISS